MPEKILVTGATGKLGSELIRLLLETDAEVKAGTRNPERAGTRFADDVEVVRLDYDVTETWDAAVQWADRVFLVPPPFDPDSDERLVPFIDWAVQSGTRHIVLVSAMGAEARDQLALRGVEGPRALEPLTALCWHLRLERGREQLEVARISEHRGVDARGIMRAVWQEPCLSRRIGAQSKLVFFGVWPQ